MLKTNPLEAFLAILWSLGAILFFFCAASGIFKGTESMQTQITQGMFGLAMLICGYYWGNSAAKKPNQPTNIQTQDNTSISIENPNNANVDPPSTNITL